MQPVSVGSQRACRLFIDNRLKPNLLSVSSEPPGPKSSRGERCTTVLLGRPRLYGQPTND